MDYYYVTAKYTLVPHVLFKKEKHTEAFKEMFDIGENEQVKTVSLPRQKAELIYAAPERMPGEYPEESRIYPLVRKLIGLAEEASQYNKAVFYLGPSSGAGEENSGKTALHLVIQEGDNLLLANTYPASHFTTALYFLFLAIRQVQFNPEQTCIRVCGNIRREEKQILEKYFRGVEATGEETLADVVK